MLTAATHSNACQQQNVRILYESFCLFVVVVFCLFVFLFALWKLDGLDLGPPVMCNPCLHGSQQVIRSVQQNGTNYQTGEMYTWKITPPTPHPHPHAEDTFSMCSPHVQNISARKIVSQKKIILKMQPKNNSHLLPHTYTMTCDTAMALSQRFLKHFQNPSRHTNLTSA